MKILKSHKFHIFLTGIVYICTAVIIIFNNCITEEQKDFYFKFYQATLPLGFSIIIYLLETIKDKKKDLLIVDKVNKDEANNLIQAYNTLYLKCIKRINFLASDFMTLELILNRLEVVVPFREIIEYWRSIAQTNPNASNDKLVRLNTQNKLEKIVETFYEKNEFIEEHEYITSITLPEQTKTCLDISDNLFTFQISSLSKSNDYIKKLNSITTNFFGDGSINYNLIKEYNESIKVYHSKFGNEIRNKTTDKNEVARLLNAIFVDFFNLFELTITELTLFEEFVENFTEIFQPTYEKFQKEITMGLNYKIVPKKLISDLPTNKYLIKENIINFYIERML